MVSVEMNQQILPCYLLCYFFCLGHTMECVVHGLGRGEGLSGSLLPFFLLSRPYAMECGCDVLNKVAALAPYVVMRPVTNCGQNMVLGAKNCIAMFSEIRDNIYFLFVPKIPWHPCAEINRCT